MRSKVPLDSGKPVRFDKFQTRGHPMPFCVSPRDRQGASRDIASDALRLWALG